jgi:LacI family transcriptional regulator
VSVYGGIRAYAKRHPDFRVVIDEWADESLPDSADEPIPYDGIIGRLGDLAADCARRLDLPAVNVWLSSPAARKLPGVFCDYAASGRLVAEHLLSRGFRNLAALPQFGDQGTAIQADAMKAFAEKAGFDRWLGTVSIASSESHDEWRQGAQAIERWMHSWHVPLGLLVRDPTWARVIVERGQERGWHVPEQIAIVCSHNDELHCDHPEPALTAVEFPDEPCGYEAAKLLDALIDAKRQGTSPHVAPRPRTIILPPVGIVARHSTDFFAVDDPLVGKALRYIAMHLHRPLDVAAVARSVGVARRTLDGWFRRALGVTVATEINRLRIERVKRELTAGDDPVEAIARRTGFTSIRTLNDQFKRGTGMSPTEYRDQGFAHEP